MTLTIQSLIQHFEDRLRQIDRQNLGNEAGREPQFPQLVVYLGSDAGRAHSAVSANLLQVWPQYQNEMKFLWVTDSDEELSYAELSCDGEKTTALSEDNVREIVSALFGTKMHFRDRSKLLVYYVLDSTGFLSGDDFLQWFPRIQEIRKLVCANSTDMLDVLFLLLNENMVRQRTAACIRNHLSGFYQNNDIRKAVGSVMLLSNRRSDNAILEDWDICYKILSAVIVLSNNAEAKITAAFFDGGVMTASYAREEKPLPQIGQVVVTALIDGLVKAIPPMDTKPLEDPQLAEKLGLTNNGTFSLLDVYAESKLYSLLPSAEHLEFFPRRDDASQVSMAMMSARAFNEYTMGAWEQYLSKLAQGVQERIARDSTIRSEWQEAYRAQLKKSFNRDELLYLVKHIQEVSEIMAGAKMPSQEAQILSAARDQLKYMLSGDNQLRQIFLSALQEQGRASQEFVELWNSLLKSMRKIHALRDNNISAYYERKVRNFYDRHGAEIAKTFSDMHEMEELEQFLRSTLNRIVDSDEIFSSAFEEELESRLNEDVLPTDAKQYIRKKLTGDDVFVYLQTNFALGEPLISAILLKVGTSLYNNLYSNLAPTTYYYNTGSSNTAEALVIYGVSAENLVNGGEV